jgi:PadR family transcriptional regulator
MTAKLLGKLELAVAMAVARVGNEAYAVTIRRDLERRFSHSISRGAVYTTLARLEEKGFLKSALGPPTATRGGRPKRFYRLTAAGSAAVMVSRQAALIRLPRFQMLEGSG